MEKNPHRWWILAAWIMDARSKSGPAVGRCDSGDSGSGSEMGWSTGPRGHPGGQGLPKGPFGCVTTCMQVPSNVGMSDASSWESDGVGKKTDRTVKNAASKFNRNVHEVGLCSTEAVGSNCAVGGCTALWWGARGVAQRLVQAVGRPQSRKCTTSSFLPPNINRAAWRQLRFSH